MKLLPLFFMPMFLFGGIIQPETTPEREEEIVREVSKETTAPLSRALFQLIQGISDQTFEESFFAKIKKLEAEKFTGEFVDYWDNGKLKIRANFKEGKVDGHVHGYFPEGLEAFKLFFYENLKVGVFMAFSPVGEEAICNSRLARKFIYNFEGQLDGTQISDYRKGRLKTHIDYLKGTLHGHYSTFLFPNICIKREVYEKGELFSKEK